jgi:hypothetical protein
VATRRDSDERTRTGIVRDAKHQTAKEGNHRRIKYSPGGSEASRLNWSYRSATRSGSPMHSHCRPACRPMRADITMRASEPAAYWRILKTTPSPFTPPEPVVP